MFFFQGCTLRYSFCRPLTQVECGILRGYTRRISSMLDYKQRLDWKSVCTLSNSPATEPLFPHLRNLRFVLANKNDTKHLLYMPFPSLTTLTLFFDGDLQVTLGSLESLCKLSPNVTKLMIHVRCSDLAFGECFFRNLCQWQNLRNVEYSGVPPDLNALGHVSCMPALTLFAFRLSSTIMDQITSSKSPLLVSNLRALTLAADFLEPISLFLLRCRLPAITDFSAFAETWLDKQDVSTFLTSVQTSGIEPTLQTLSLSQRHSSALGGDFQPVLGFEGLQPCMALSNLRRINFDLEWMVDLKDDDLLAFASTWPHLEYLTINVNWGWHTPGGITPNGLLQLLQTCQSLSRVALAIDTRGYTECDLSPGSLGFTLPSNFSINVVDSAIEEECVPAIAAFFASIAPSPNFSFHASPDSTVRRFIYRERWDDVYKLANEAVRQRFLVSRILVRV